MHAIPPQANAEILDAAHPNLALIAGRSER
jgi:hypothetical protein